MKFQFRLICLLSLIFAASASLPAATSIDWNFNPSKVGNVLIEGGWSLDYQLGVINGSPEFSLPVQLVYLSTRQNKGLFGNQWFCPQLESKLVPKGAGFPDLDDALGRTSGTQDQHELHKFLNAIRLITGSRAIPLPTTNILPIPKIRITSSVDRSKAGARVE